MLELAELYDTYQTQLQAQRWADRIGLSWLAVEALANRAPNACCDWPLLIVDGFDDFTPIQLALLQTLARRTGDFYLTLPQAAQTDFTRYDRTRQAVETALGQLAQPLPSQPTNPLHPALAHLSATLFADRAAEPLNPQPAAPASTGAVTGVAMREVPDYAAEVRTALRWLKQQIVSRSLRPNDVALLARDMTPYRPFIAQVAAEFGLPVRTADGLPLLQSPVVAALLELLRVHLPATDGTPSLARRDVVAAWRSPYFDWTDGNITVGPPEADQLDSLARQFRVIRGREQWLAAFDDAAKVWTAEWPDDDAEAFAATAPDPALAGMLRDRFNHFLQRTQPPTGTATTMSAYVRWLEGLIGPDDISDRSHPLPGENPRRRPCAGRPLSAPDCLRPFQSTHGSGRSGRPARAERCAAWAGLGRGCGRRAGSGRFSVVLCRTGRRDQHRPFRAAGPYP